APPARLHAPPGVGDRAAGVRVEVGRVAEQRLVVVAHQAPARVAAHEVDAELRIGPVADHVAQAHELGHAALADVGEDRLERRAVRVEVGDDRELQRARPFPSGPGAPFAGSGAGPGPSCVSAAATTRARTSPSAPAMVAPEALTCPPPPKPRARRFTSKAV